MSIANNFSTVGSTVDFETPILITLAPMLSKIVTMPTDTANQESATVEPGPCSRCATDTDQKCDRCHAVFYCSPECKHFEQHFHMALCKTYESFLVPPQNGSVRVTVLPVDSKEPR